MGEERIRIESYDMPEGKLHILSIFHSIYNKKEMHNICMESGDNTPIGFWLNFLYSLFKLIEFTQ
jgi:hypothetical protein